jgi:NAD(P)-dependent dehydrogenase (short-subunit alcohol dehydrogenase family)
LWKQLNNIIIDGHTYVYRLYAFLKSFFTMNKLLKDQFAVITGGSDGIGKAIATLFATHGARLWLIGRNANKLLQVQEELKTHGSEVRFTCADISIDKEWERVCQDIKQQWPLINILVNNAGIAAFTPFEQVKKEHYHLQFDLNVKAAIFFSQLLLPNLLAACGNIINISSYFSDRLLPNTPSSIYSASRGAINSFTKALALELGPYVRVNAIAPGTIATALVASNLEKMSAERKREFERHIHTNYPMKCIGKAEHIAEMALFLASQKAEWITGSIFPVDGGLSVT